MAAAGTYYIDTINFADANEVFLDEALTTCAPNGFYQMGGATAREQVDCVNGVGGRLLDAEACPSCTPPTPDPPIAANISYKVTDVVTSAVEFVAITNAYQPTQKITTNLSANCWLINNASTDAVTATITGPCNVQPVDQPLYFLLASCSGAGSAYTTIVDAATNLPLTNARYQDANTGLFYVYQNAPGVATTNVGIPIISTLSQSGTGCPVAPTEFSYWNATPCSGGSSVTIKSNNPPNSNGTTFTEGTTSVKVSGTCYVINNFLQTTSAVVSNIGVYAGTAYTGCQTGANPCIPAVVATPSFDVVETTSGDTNRVTKRNGFSQNDNIVITGLAGCWKLVSPSTVATPNTIQDFCPAVSSCTTYVFTGTGYYITCSAGAGGTQSYLNLSPGITETICAITGSVAAGNISSQSGGCNSDVPITPQYNYYNVELCSGGGATIVRVPVGTTLTTNQSVKINNGSTCYKVLSGSGSTTTQDATNITSGCDVCDPPATCFIYAVEYSPGTTVCLTGGQGVVFGDTNNFLTATQLFASQAGCTTSQAAVVGVYTFTKDGIRTSRYWNGSTLGTAQTCNSSTPQNVTATITAIDTTGLTGGVAGTNYSLSGDIISSFISGLAPLDTNPGTFDTRVLITQGFTGSNINITYAPTSINSDQDITMTITGTITQDAGVLVYAVTGCNNKFWNIEYSGTTPPTLTQGSTIFYRLNAGGITECGIVGQQQPAGTSTSGRFLLRISSVYACNNSRCQ